MNAVVLTVKASYVASTKYRKLETKVLLQFLHTFSKGISAIVYFQRVLLLSYISKGHCCHPILPKGITVVIYFQKAFLPSYIFQMGIAVIIQFQRALLTFYTSKGHRCHRIFPKGIAAITYGHCCHHIFL